MDRRLEDWMLHWFPTVGRIMIAVLFIQAAYVKMSAFERVVLDADNHSVPFADTAVTLAIIVELCAGLLILIGFKAREACMALFTAVALYTLFFHLDFNDSAQLDHLMKNLAIMGGMLYIIAFGAGRLSFDRIGEDEKIRKLASATM